MQLGPEAGGEADAGQGVGLLCVGVELDAQRLLGHGHDELPVGAQPGALGRLQVDADEQVVVAAAQRAGQVRVLGGVEQLRLVHMAAQGVSHAVVAQSADGAVEHERVVVELHQVQTLRQLQDVDAPEDGKQKMSC